MPAEAGPPIALSSNGWPNGRGCADIGRWNVPRTPSPMSDNRTNRRKTLVVNPQQQKQLVMTMSLIPSIGLAATMGLICYFCNNLYNEAVQLQVHLDGLMPLFLAVSGFVLVSGFFMISNALMISHRIAGPSYRLAKSMEQIREGDIAFQVNLRKGDHLTELRDELNQLLDVLNDNPPPGFRTREMRAAEEAAAGADAEIATETTATPTEEPVLAAATED
jgi:nitrogen fixation/metabolism regulation signal transduction histidine kinase